MKVDQEQTTELHLRVGRLEGLVEGIHRQLDRLTQEFEAFRAEIRAEIGNLQREQRRIGLALAVLITALGLWA